MSAARRHSSSSSGRSRASRGGGSNHNAAMVPVIITSVTVVLIIAMIAMSGGGGGDSGGDKPTRPKAQQPAAPAPTPTPTISGSGTPGKQPDRPAPEVTPAMLAELDRLLAEAKGHFNDYQRKHLSDDQTGDMEHAQKAKECLQQMFKVMDEALLWEEEASMEGWAMPASYGAMLRRYKSYSTLDKKVRMTGV